MNRIGQTDGQTEMHPEMYNYIDMDEQGSQNEIGSLDLFSLFFVWFFSILFCVFVFGFFVSF